MAATRLDVLLRKFWRLGMTDKVSLSGPIKIAPDNNAAVAFEMMKFLRGLGNDVDKKDPQYWLALYRKCYKATHGFPLESILKDD